MEFGSRVYNFSAGPAALPEPVLEQARAELLNWQGLGVSVMEISHRSDAFTAMAQRAERDLRELLGVPENYKVLFLQGGGTQQFSQVPMNFMRANGVCDYVDTGYWSRKALVAAARYGAVNVTASAASSGFTSIPRESARRISSAPAYLHYTANETIDGLEFHWTPDVGQVPLVADFSANILSGPLDISRFGLIYAGAQKNVGPSGMTIVIVREDLITRKALAFCPDLMDYSVLAEHGSMYNTPPTFSWYVAGLVFQWLKSVGGLDTMRRLNERKGNILYNLIDSSDFYLNEVDRADRSNMSIPFRLAEPQLDGAFLSGANERGLMGLKGHRAKGGFRASLYNAVSEQAVQSLARYMADFEKSHGR